MRILGISAFYHDSAAALIRDGEIIAAAQEERFSRIKHDARFPSHSLQYCLSQEGVSLEQIDHVVFYDKPFLKFERLIETYIAFAPRGLRSFQMAIPLWLREKLFQKTLLRDELNKHTKRKIDWDERLLFTEHHLSHAASAFFCNHGSNVVCSPRSFMKRAIHRAPIPLNPPPSPFSPAAGK